MRSTEGEGQGTTEATGTMSTAAGRRILTDDLQEYKETAGVGGKYCAGGSDT